MHFRRLLSIMPAFYSITGFSTNIYSASPPKLAHHWAPRGWGVGSRGHGRDGACGCGWGPYAQGWPGDWLGHAPSHSLSLGLKTSFCFCGDSGGHFNPAVSLAAMLVGGLNLTMLLPYWVSQLCGGLLGASLAKVGDPLGRAFGGRGRDCLTCLFPPVGLVGPSLLVHSKPTLFSLRLDSPGQRRQSSAPEVFLPVPSWLAMGLLVLMLLHVSSIHSLSNSLSHRWPT